MSHVFVMKMGGWIGWYKVGGGKSWFTLSGPAPDFGGLVYGFCGSHSFG